MEPAQRMTVIELLEHQWLNEGTVPDVPLDTPSIIVSDEVCRSEFDTGRPRVVTLSLCPSCAMRKKIAGKKWPREILGASRSALLVPRTSPPPIIPRGLFAVSLDGLSEIGLLVVYGTVQSKIAV